jgi:hypothetical protein
LATLLLTDHYTATHSAYKVDSKVRAIKMISRIINMIWIYLFTSLIAANAGATIITKTHITTT